jgi:ATP-dependent DNA helicase RecG
LLSLIAHGDILESARDFATEVVERDPTLAQHPALASMVSAALDSDRIEYLEKS